MNHLTAKKLEELNNIHLENIKALFAADALIAEYELFAKTHDLAVVVSTCMGSVTVFASGKANHICTDATKFDHPIITGNVHLIDEFYVNNTEV